MPFIKELKRLGLKDKEAAVYIASLELGPSPVQTIARKAKVVRATTYVILEALSKAGLVTQFKQGKKTLYSAEPPSQLLRLLEKQQEEIAEKQRDLQVLLPELQMIARSGEGHPTARFFEGLEGLRAIRAEMAMYSRRGDVWYNFTPIDYLAATFGENEVVYGEYRVAKGIKSKTIFTTRSKKVKDEMLGVAADENSERKFIDPKFFQSSSGMTIYRDRIAIGHFTGHIGGVVIESESMAQMMREFFELTWRMLDSIDTAK